MELSFGQLINILDNANEKVIAKAEEGLNEIAEDLLNASAQLAPIESGDLMGSGSVDPASRDGEQIVAKVGYNKEYALRMHEDMYQLGDLSNQKPDFDGMKVGRKYLQRPTQKYSEKYAEHLAKKMEEVF